jgi:hypothetical protein
VRPPADLPARIGPVEFGTLGGTVAVRCPRDLDPVMRRAGGMWEPGTRRSTDPLFRQAGMDLDEG